MTDPVAPLASVSIDCPDTDALAGFYARLLGLEEVFAAPDRSVVCLGGAPGPVVTLVQVERHEPVAWPDGPSRVHLDLAAEDLEADVAAALALGAREAPVQPAPDRWRVLLDPAGHPFCLSVVRPD